MKYGSVLPRRIGSVMYQPESSRSRHKKVLMNTELFMGAYYLSSMPESKPEKHRKRKKPNRTSTMERYTKPVLSTTLHVDPNSMAPKGVAPQPNGKHKVQESSPVYCSFDSSLIESHPSTNPLHPTMGRPHQTAPSTTLHVDPSSMAPTGVAPQLNGKHKVQDDLFCVCHSPRNSFIKSCSSIASATIPNV